MLRIGLSLLLAIVMLGELEGQAQPDRGVAGIASRWVPEPLPPVFALEAEPAAAPRNRYLALIARRGGRSGQAAGGQADGGA